jgi:uncharacterized membrane protein
MKSFLFSINKSIYLLGKFWNAFNPIFILIFIILFITTIFLFLKNKDLESKEKNKRRMIKITKYFIIYIILYFIMRLLLIVLIPQIPNNV